MARSLFYRRRFLNRRGHHAGAYVVADVELARSSREDKPHIYADLTIADCNRVASLDFSVTQDRSVTNVLHKARLLKDVLDGFVVALETAIEERENSPRDPVG